MSAISGEKPALLMVLRMRAVQQVLAWDWIAVGGPPRSRVRLSFVFCLGARRAALAREFVVVGNRVPAFRSPDGSSRVPALVIEELPRQFEEDRRTGQSGALS
jgi:hypothetical protein